MQNLGLWGDVSHLLQKQHETVFLVVKSYKMWVSWGGGVAFLFICIDMHICMCMSTFTSMISIIISLVLTVAVLLIIFFVFLPFFLSLL